MERKRVSKIMLTLLSVGVMLAMAINIQPSKQDWSWTDVRLPFWTLWWFWGIAAGVIIASSEAVTRKWFQGHVWEPAIAISSTTVLIGWFKTNMPLFIIGIIIVGIGVIGFIVRD